MAKYSKGAQKTVKSSMERMEKGTLKSGKSIYINVFCTM